MKGIFENEASWRRFLGLISVLFFLPLLVHGYIGFFTRLISDDYCTAAVVRAYGFLGAQKHWFETWTGRFSFTLAISAVHLVGVKLVSVLPVIALGLWLGVMTWALLQIARMGFWSRSTMTCLMLGELIIVSTLSATPAVYQSLYWSTGMLTYVAPLIILTFYIGFICRMAAPIATDVDSRPSVKLLFLSGGATAIAGGFSETYAAMQMAGLLVAGAIFFMDGAELVRRRVLALLAAGFVGSLFSAILLLVAPGNEARISSSFNRPSAPTPGTWLSFAILSFRFTLDSAYRSISSPPALAVFFLPLLLAFRRHDSASDPSARSRNEDHSLATALIAVPVVGLFLIFCCLVPSAYVAAFIRGGYRPQLRLFIIPQFVFFCCACVWTYLAGVFFRERRLLRLEHAPQYLIWGWKLIVGLIVAAPFFAARQTWSLGPTVRPYASVWDLQDRQIRLAQQAGAREVTVQSLPNTGHDARGRLFYGLRLIDSEPTNWVNGCAAEYYGLDRIIAK